VAVIDLSAFQSLQCATAHDGIYLPDEECHGISLLDAECQGKCRPDDTCHGICLPDEECQGICRLDAECQGICLLDAARVLQTQSVKANGIQTRLTMAHHT